MGINEEKPKGILDKIRKKLPKGIGTYVGGSIRKGTAKQQEKPQAKKPTKKRKYA